MSKSVSTKTGDKGMTGLGDGTRVSKNDPVIHAIGMVDEANCYFGLVNSITVIPRNIRKYVTQVQNDLFDLGSDLSMPVSSTKEDKVPRITKEYVDRLEEWLKETEKELLPLTNFVLPGGTELASRFHLARAKVREAERSVVRAKGPVLKFDYIIQYLNRLSDCCFQWARYCNDYGMNDVIWKPEKKC